MFQHRELGLNQAYQIVSTVIITVLYWLWFTALNSLFPSFSLAGISDYFQYFLAIILGFQISFLGKKDQDIFSVNSGILESHRVVSPHILFATAITCLFLVLSKDDRISRLFLFTFIPLAYVALIIFSRYFAFPILHWLQRHQRQSLVLVGKTSEIGKVDSLLSKAKFFGMETLGIVTEEPAESLPLEIKKLGDPSDLGAVLDRVSVRNLLILGSPRDRRVLGEWLRLAEKHGCRVSMVNDLDIFLQRRLSYFRCDDVDLIELREEPLQNAVNRVVKRFFDILVSLPVVCLVLPILMLAVWILQRIQAPGELLFRQLRSGIDNQPFTILKFRTMYADQCDSTAQATTTDGRIFPAGRILRRFSLDEFPQFFNVLIGQMSIVGPRPHILQHDEVFAKVMSNYAIRGFVKPGLSGLAQIRGFRGEAITEEDIIRRVDCDIEYIETWSIVLDVRIVWQTFLQMIRPPKTAY